MQTTGMVSRVKQEVSIHSRLKHPSILELYECFEDVNYVYLVLELCHNGELQKYIKQKVVLLIYSSLNNVSFCSLYLKRRLVISWDKLLMELNIYIHIVFFIEIYLHPTFY